MKTVGGSTFPPGSSSAPVGPVVSTRPPRSRKPFTAAAICLLIGRRVHRRRQHKRRMRRINAARGHRSAAASAMSFSQSPAASGTQPSLPAVRCYKSLACASSSAVLGASTLTTTISSRITALIHSTIRRSLQRASLTLPASPGMHRQPLKALPGRAELLRIRLALSIPALFERARQSTQLALFCRSRLQ